MASVIESPVVHEISAAEGAIQAKATFTPGYTNGVVIEESWPQGLGEDDWDIRKIVFDELADYHIEREEREENRKWIDAVVSPSGPSAEYTTRISPKQFGGFVGSGLGFSLDTQEETIGGRTTRVRQYSYPSIERANDFMTEAFGEEGQLEFVPYEGGHYSAEEFMKSFIENRIPIATEHPDDIHDLSDHVIGWIGIDPMFVRTFQSRVAVYLERLEKEREVQPNLDLIEIGSEYMRGEKLEKTHQFFLPSLAILKASMRSIEVVTSQIAETALTNQGVSGSFTLADVLGRHMESAFDIYDRENGPGNSLPSGLLGTISQSQAYQFGAQTHLRFEQADQIANEKGRQT